MPSVPPATLSPSKVSAFASCPLAFRYSAIDRLPEPPTVAATKGTVVHLALEHLFARPAEDRTPEHAQADLERALAELRDHPEYAGLALDEAAEQAFVADARRIVAKYFDLEDPRAVHPVGLELMLEAKVGDIRVRGIIDRLELDAEGGLVVTDYKTGRSPSATHQQGRLGGVVFYALLCQELFGVLPSRIQLLYLADGLSITTDPTEQSLRGLRTKIAALWQAIERACEKDDFRPRTGPLCAYCGFHAYCPAQGGDPSLVPAIVAERDAAEAAARAAEEQPVEVVPAHA